MKKILSKYAELGRTVSKRLKVKKGDSFYCYPQCNEIHIPMVWNEEQTKHFIDNIKTKYNPEWVDQIDDYIWCFLHELGHIEMDRFYISDMLFRPILVFFANLSFMTKLVDTLYYKLPKETDATDWAIHYVNKNFKQLLKFQKELRRVYIRYYKSTGMKVA